jgi:hypothetical protein
MKVKPTELWSSNIGCLTVPTLTLDQYDSLQNRKETEVSKEAAEYLINNNYAEEVEGKPKKAKENKE